MEENNRIFPTKHLMQVKIPLAEYSAFKSIWNSDKVLNFYCLGKQVDGDYLTLNIRAMRINEFVNILNEHKINWTKP